MICQLSQFFNNFTIVDLTHPLTSSIPTWDNSCGFRLENDEIILITSAGTHIDAPSHFFENKCSIDSLDIKQLIVPVCLIDVSNKANADYAISLQDIQNDEIDHGAITKNSIVVGYTGWSRNWSDPKAYRNADGNGNMQFPVFSIKAIEYLLEREIAGIAIDSFSPEPINSHYPIHELLLNEGKYIIENIANCQLLPRRGAYIIALPLKVQESGEAPARVIGLIPIQKTL